MRLSSQNSQFIFNLPIDIIETYLEEQFNKLMEKNFIPYDSVGSYLSSTIKNITFPSLTFEAHPQTIRFGKKINFKDSKSVFDNFSNELSITFRSVDSHLNYFMLQQMLLEFYLNNDKHQLDMFYIKILDKDGDLIYTIFFKEVIFKSLSELQLDYNTNDISDKTFSISFIYNWIDIRWELDDEDVKTSTSVFDIPKPPSTFYNESEPPIYYKPGELDKI